MIFREVVASLYAWDLLDEGLDHMLDVLERETLTNSVYLVALMHHEKRPLTDFYYPHNPRRKVYWTEDSRAYWRPDPDSYKHSRIKPRLSDNAEMQGRDWLQELIDGGRKRGMTTGVELSHSWVDAEQAAAEYPDCLQRDIYGRPLGELLCPNHLDLRAYGIALYVDLVTHYDVDYIQTCLRLFSPGRALAPAAPFASAEAARLAGLSLGGCFCEQCGAAAARRGLDWQAIVDRLRWLADGFDSHNARQAFDLRLLLHGSTSATELVAEIPELYEFVRFRCESVTSFFGAIYEAAHQARPGIDIRLNRTAGIDVHQGLDTKNVCRFMDSVRSSDYSEQAGDPKRMEWKRAFLHGIRRAIGLDKYFLSAVSPRPKATPELVRQGILISAQCGADALTIGHYDGAWMNCLRAVKQGLEEAGIEVRR